MTHPGSGNPTWQSYPSTQTPITALALESIETALDQMPGQVFFRLDCTADFTQATSDLLAGGGWSIVKDTHGGGAVGANNGDTKYTIPVAGRLWDVMLTVVTMSQSLNAGFSGKVTLNGATNASVPATAITSDFSELLGAESYVRAWKMGVPLAKNDVLRPATWASVQITIRAQRFGQQTQLIVRDAGPA